MSLVEILEVVVSYLIIILVLLWEEKTRRSEDALIKEHHNKLMELANMNIPSDDLRAIIFYDMIIA